ncbi:hypothetical protein GQ53DRAFT_889819 [Thozetella sp. PMI_491]|nr:hypothetical protein GQ53DRAFT_889819 [Thozetella sp. PMI_491]
MFRKGRFKSMPLFDEPSYADEPRSDAHPSLNKAAAIESSKSQKQSTLPFLPFHSRKLLGSSLSTFSTTTRAPEGQEDPLGLQVAYDIDNSVGDLVFVHGLGGSAWKSFSWNRDTSCFWPRWLPSEEEILSKFRILTFGYNSKFHGAAANLDILDFAKDLLLQLMTAASTNPEHQSRPIIFIVHSMGGLVVKKAYSLGKHDKLYANLVSRIRGIVFLSTPHRGSRYAKVLNKILSAMPLGRPPKAYVAGLEMQSSAIQDINESFRQQCDGLLLCSFYETLKTSLRLTKVLIVEKDSAILGYPNEMSAAMDANHHTVCKYKDRSDPNFIKVKGVLKTWAAQLVPTEPGLTGASISLIADPQAFPIIEHRIQDIFGALRPTTSRPSTPNGTKPKGGAWLLDKPGFQAWSAATNSKFSHFWLIGLPGTGKTVLAQSVLENLRAQGHDVHSHFFDRTHQLQRTASYCLRSLATQLALSNAIFREALFELHEKTGLKFNDQHQTLNSIWDRVFEGIIFHLPFEKPLFWILDGIDESDVPTGLFSRLSSIPSNIPIRVLFSSLPLKNAVGIDQSRIQTYFLQASDTETDMTAYVTRTLCALLPDNQEIQQIIRSEILRKAAGSFLWTRLALELMQERWHTEEDIKLVLEEVPKGMAAMYSRMVTTLEEQMPRNIELAKHVLTWVVCGWRPLYIDELAEALRPKFGAFTNLELTIRQLCGQFVTVGRREGGRSKASLIHTTARDFLVHGDEEHSPWISPKQAHEQIARTCLSYLCNDMWRRHFSAFENPAAASSGVSRTNNLQIAAVEYPLLEYATYHWAYHISKASSDSPALMEALKEFMLTSCLSWIEGIALSGNIAHLIRSAQFLKTYVKEAKGNTSNNILSRPQLRSPASQTSVDWIQPWATDFIRIAGKFGANLILNPSSVYWNVPPMCPRQSMVGTTFNSLRPIALSVVGLGSSTWDDCQASVVIGNDKTANQVLASDSYFFTLSGSNGIITAWGTEACEKIRELSHGEYVARMTLNRDGTLLAARGYSNIHVWECSSGRLLHRIPQALRGVLRDIRFAPSNTELLLIYGTWVVQHVQLGPPYVVTTQEISLSGLESEYCSAIWRATISNDMSKVALVWRGRPALVWNRQTGGLVRCRAPADPAQVLWHPESRNLLIMGQQTGLFEWCMTDDDLIEYPQVKNCQEMVVSSDGNFLLTTDQNGTLQVWAFPRLHLIYSKPNEGEGTISMCLSPDNQRFYDLRGLSCNVWEPDALVRSDDSDLDETSNAAGSYALTEPVLSTSSGTTMPVTTLVLGPTNEYFACAREDGSVIIHDLTDGKRLRKVYTHPAATPVMKLSWSKKGKYMASLDENHLLVIKRIQLKGDGKWAVFPGFEVRLAEAVHQIFFSADEKLLLVSTRQGERVWDIKGKAEAWVRLSDDCSGHWAQHPAEASSLILIETTGVNTYSWASGSKLSENFPVPAKKSPAPTFVLGDKPSDHRPLSQSRSRCSRRVIWCSEIGDSGYHFIVASTGSNLVVTESHRNLNLEVVSLKGHQDGQNKQTRSTVTNHITSKVRLLLGTQGNSLIFLSLEGWICSYDLSPILSTIDRSSGLMAMQDMGSSRANNDVTKRHFFPPRDWLNIPTTHMAVVGVDGTFLCPKQGEVAIVRNGLKI